MKETHKQHEPQSIFFDVVPAQELEMLKPRLFEGGGIEDTEVEPHGIDFPVEEFLDYSALIERGLRFDKDYTPNMPDEELQRLGRVHFEERKQGDETVRVAHLQPGHAYFALLGPRLKFTADKLRELDLDIRTYPKSTLLRVGIEGIESDWQPNRSYISLYQKIFSSFPDGRTTFYLRVLNPSGVDIEADAPLAHIAIRRGLRSMQPQLLSETLPKEWTREGRPLTLGNVFQFTSQIPLIAKKKENRVVKVTEPVPMNGNEFHLPAGLYLFQGREEVSLAEDERGRLGPMVNMPRLATIATAEGLVDAGFHGHLHYLVNIAQEATVQRGERFGTLFIDKVPPTQKLYSGQWQKKP